MGTFPLITVAEADRRLATLVPEPEFEVVPLHRAVGRVLAAPLVADRDGPPFPRVSMDGYAIDTNGGGRSWTLEGFQAAGRPPLSRSRPGTAVEVATGAVLPGGCDAVIPYEEAERSGATVALKDGSSKVVSGQNIVPQGSDYHTGGLLLPAGTRLRSPHLHSLATTGHPTVKVIRRAQWSLVATGDELVEVQDTPERWQIRRSNGAAIAGESGAWGLEPRELVVLPDHKKRLRAGLTAILPDLDVLVLTGGVSVGALDLVPEVLADLGAQVLFHRLDQRPGKPLWCGWLPRSTQGRTVIFGLPGNPVSSLFSFRRYVLPWLLTFEGRSPVEGRVRLTEAPGTPPPGQTWFLPWSGSSFLGWKGSGDFSALAESTGFIQVDDPQSLFEPRYFPWGGSQ